MGSYISRRMTEESARTDSDADSDSDLEGLHYRTFWGELISSGYVDLSSPTLPDMYCGPRLTKINNLKNSATLDASEFSLITKQSSGMLNEGSHMTKDNNITDILSNRETGLYHNNNFSYAKKCKITNRFLPNDVTLLESFAGKVFCGIFSRDGDRFVTASQDRSIRLFDSSNDSYKLLHSVRARDVGWSIVDIAFSPNREHFVYSTWSTALHICSTNKNNDLQEPLSLLVSGRRFCVFSVVFSSDGKELLGGANDGCLYIYDLQRHDRTLNIAAHEYDVNTVCFADDSSHIIYSGGDDGIVKVWDRRTLVESFPKPVGVLAGHMDGITFVDSRGDGRHLISNSKDQSIKLWDIRVFSSEKAAERSLKAVHEQIWDYRWQEVPKKMCTNRNKLAGDTSVMTYRGHIVIKTLVRCRFSPLETTGQRYIYTGCGMGRVVIYDSLTGQIQENINGHMACVRDVAWHPARNEILSSSWDGTVGKWTYTDRRSMEDGNDWDTEEMVRARSSVRRSLRLALKKKKGNN